MCGENLFTDSDNAFMLDGEDKNGGPVFLKAWRDHRDFTQDQLAERVGTNANMIGYLEKGERALTTKWLRKLAPVLDTTPGMLIAHDPREIDSDLLDIWVNADPRQKARLAEIVKAVVRTDMNRTGTDG